MKESVSKQQVSAAAKNQLWNRKRDVPKWERGEASCISWPHRASQKLQACLKCLSWLTPVPFCHGWRHSGWKVSGRLPVRVLMRCVFWEFDDLGWISGNRHAAEPAGSDLFNHSALIWRSACSRCQPWHRHHSHLINFSISWGRQRSSPLDRL